MIWQTMNDKNFDILMTVLVRGFFGLLVGAGIGLLLWAQLSTAWSFCAVPVCIAGAIAFGDDFYRWLVRFFP